ncbi:ABC transporter ATP-binding protein [Deinococcus maricopensis]|nr:ATP-binding cassette domain-containing protein [Deinococcus maricopensis]
MSLTMTRPEATTAARAQGAPLTLDGVTYRYDGRAGVGPLDVQVRAGEFVCVIGPSGSGKSTLLALLAGFLAPQSGRILLGKGEVRGPDPRLTLVQQEHALFPWRTVLGNVTFGLEARRVPRAERVARAQAALALVGLPDAGKRRVHQLSGGQRQRVALARALAVQPELLLLDEPFSALDVQTRETLGDEVLRLWREAGCTVVFVTHHLDEALSLGQRVIALKDGEVALDAPAADLTREELARVIRQ